MRRPTAASFLPMRCILLLVSFFVIADSTEAVAKDSIDRNNLIRRKGASPSSQRSLHVQDDEPRIDAPAPDEKSEEAINGSKFYDMADWSKNDVSPRLLGALFRALLLLMLRFSLSTFGTWHLTDFSYSIPSTTIETTAAQSPESDERHSPRYGHGHPSRSLHGSNSSRRP